MISRDDVFRCSGGRCEFLSRGKTPVSINNRHAFESPRVHVSHVAACVMAEKLLSPLRCVIETTPTPMGFEYLFKNSVEMKQRAPTEIILRLEELHTWLDTSRDRSARGTHIDMYINDDGRRMFTWLLSALFAEEYYLFASEVRASWSTSNARRLPNTTPKMPVTR